MKKHIITLSLLGLVVASCSNSGNFSISSETVGPLTKTTKVSELKTAFANDSLVDATGATDFKTPQGYVTVFEKGGKKLLELGPSSNESDATINYIRVYDERFKTTEGVTTKSTFKDIQDGYKIKRIDNLISTIVVLIEDNDIFFTIDKKHLPSELMFDTQSKVELSQIPDDAPIKYVQISW
ncbi:hypothetical protein [uncultured Dokdonia sp.]|jgi:hypothetical protein|uniref:hypothetical protein n=1 Tax=Dokdonia sp. R78006 TaxID=3093866 RepID=UPI0026268DCE|nr:hypothetical protein [uncultured Dokdonia sp.]